ncbi:ABC transporter ATP-binding protein [Leucobacter luti]|uniref:ABC-2 type transport system ATP-binding protein n=1 Tax=Leucobacter luti TaxID=340320 RepID=A0A4Q7TSF1_9MICO|nr:ABC transporter ATP-binding protein [Leucobacter luti]MBL3700035.1 ABC transporter ATP-binding protein [Leucobacter luti]RZT62648.1 ABC-2 type transport system ATP-binding protein [Leucobacter luti]
MTTTAIETRGVSRHYRGAAALDDVTLDIRANVITGLLGRNGAGKTTLMALLTAQDRPSSGTISVAGHDPFERSATIEQMCFVRDNQRYPDDYKLKHAIRAAAIFYPHWSQELADRLIAKFRIPTKPVVKKFSRGQLSALGIVLGLASRAPITFFDEPYLGLDATARGVFYDELLRDYAEHPRTIILSTHLIDEMDRLLERVIILEQGRVVRHADVEELRGDAYQIAGKASALETYLAGREILSRRGMGGLGSAVVNGALTPADREAALGLGLELTPVSLQDLVAAYGFDREGAETTATPSYEGNAA